MQSTLGKCFFLLHTLSCTRSIQFAHPTLELVNYLARHDIQVKSEALPVFHCVMFGGSNKMSVPVLFNFVQISLYKRCKTKPEGFCQKLVARAEHFLLNHMLKEVNPPPGPVFSQKSPPAFYPLISCRSSYL